ncbi:MAG: helix-turn-helix transcriptional regulator [Firmicutes bacterium]|nr:helix-turn-helix transcriptional regulator [Bacillota bacterium]
MKVSLKEYGKANFMKFIRESTGLTQKEFGELINKSERTIQEYESGSINFTSDVLEEITKKTNVNIIAEKRD